MLNEIPNRLIEQEANAVGAIPVDSSPKADWPDWHDYVTGRKLEPSEVLKEIEDEANYWGRQTLKKLEKFLEKPPFENHLSKNPLEDEVHSKDPDAPLSEYVEADKKKDALIKNHSMTNENFAERSERRKRLPSEGQASDLLSGE
jgi:hypothetical protein